MRYEFKYGDLLKSQAEALVNPVNCVGVMGAGLALQFKNFSMNNFLLYKLQCSYHKVQIGEVLVFTFQKNPTRYIINFPTKRHWRDKSYLPDIKVGLIDLATQITALDIQSIAIPKLGCGLGGLNWEKEVYPMILDILGNLSLEIEIYV